MQRRVIIMATWDIQRRKPVWKVRPGRPVTIALCAVANHRLKKKIRTHSFTHRKIFMTRSAVLLSHNNNILPPLLPPQLLLLLLLLPPLLPQQQLLLLPPDVSIASIAFLHGYRHSSSTYCQSRALISTPRTIHIN